MKKLFTRYMILCMVLSVACEAQDQIPSKEVQIAGALLAAPEGMRDQASVWGYDQKGQWVELKAGSNDMICTADDYQREGFNAASYHRDLHSFMLRGRELRAEGIKGQELFDRREQEVRDGALKMPEQPTTLHILTGASFSTDSMQVVDPYYRYVVYIPYATPESTGLPPKPRAPGEPWIMDPGTHRAHIMITPPRKK